MLESIRFSRAFGHHFLLARLGRSSWSTAGHQVAQQSAFPEFLRASTVGPAKLRLPSSHRTTWPFASTSSWKGAASKTQGNCLTVHGEREDNSDDRGCYVKLRFKSRYVLPEDYDPETVEFHPTPNGHLPFVAPRGNASKELAAPVEVKYASASCYAQKC